jgi:hypothetical protein
VDVEITELEKIEADRVDGVGTPANGIPFLLMKSAGVSKDWAAWDAAHEGGSGGSNAGAASAQAEARQTQAQERTKGKGKPTAAQLHNAHEVHVAHEEHEAHLHAEHEQHEGHTEHETHEEHERAMAAHRAKAKTSTSTSTASAPKPSAQQEAKDKQLSRKAVLAAVVKAVDADGMIDEGPDVDLGQQIMSLLAQAIINEAQEIKAGAYGESCDVDLLNSAASMVRMWIGRESEPDEGSPMGLLMAAAKAAGDVGKGGPSKAERDKAADEGNALPDGSYPIRNAKELHSAAVLARSGHGDAAAAKRLIARRSKELGVANPLDTSDDTSKSTVAPEGADVDTEPQGNEGLSKALEAAVTKAGQLEERVNALDAALAKVKATPIPGGPMMSHTRQSLKADDGEDWAAKAAYFRAMADSLSSDPAAADGYRQRARQAEEKAIR